MRRFFRRLGLAGLGLICLALAPIGYVELACRPQVRASTYSPILPPEHRRPEGRTLMTYPEWHIVHAYDDYARVIRDGEPHHFGFLAAIAGFWSSLCSLSVNSGDHGGFSGPVKQTVYTIGVSFSTEMLAKAAYEETLGRVAVLLRGPTRTPLDDVSAGQAADYARFLQQVPWYQWDFAADAVVLRERATDVLRDRERRIALGLEYRAKAVYARLIAKAVETMEPDALRLRMVVTGLEPESLAPLEGVTIIGERAQGIEIETPRYRALTRLLAELAERGGEFVEIAGNDDILFTALSDTDEIDGALHSFRRQGHGDVRHLILVRVSALAETLRRLETRGLRLEHVHDY